MASSDFSGDALEIAHRVMYELLGRRWVWPAVTTTETHQTRNGQRSIILQGRPVIEIEYVRVEGTTENLAFVEENKHRIRFTPPLGWQSRWCGNPPRIEVRYTYGSEPPANVEYAIELLAEEMEKSMLGDSASKLPKRVTSISRQGISMAILDPMTYLDEGKTGIPEVDAVIRAFNPGKARAPARVFGRANPPAARKDTVQSEV